MPFTYVNRKGQTYYLHVRLTGAATGREQRHYYFNRHPDQALARQPPGYVIDEVPCTGVPALRKSGSRGDGRPRVAVDGGVAT